MSILIWLFLSDFEILPFAILVHLEFKSFRLSSISMKVVDIPAQMEAVGRDDPGSKDGGYDSSEV